MRQSSDNLPYLVKLHLAANGGCASGHQSRVSFVTRREVKDAFNFELSAFPQP
jgi:hypothetical protein